MGNWQPIETAPDGEPVLIYLAPIDAVHMAHRADTVWYCSGGTKFPASCITHWMPVPAPPVEVRDGDE